jgi:hypothetical protein
MLISIPTGTSTIFGAFQAIFDFSHVAARVPNAREATSAVRTAQARVFSHLPTSKHASDPAWAAFHKFGASVPHRRRYSSRDTTVAI